MTTGHDFDERFERIDRFEDISALLDGELDPARAAQVEGWIATDPEARPHQMCRRDIGRIIQPERRLQA